MSELELPEVRSNLEYYLERLADLSRASWVDGQLDYVIHFFFDDSDFATDAIGYVGLALHTEAEARAVSRVVADLDEVLRRHHTDASTTTLVSDPGWSNVVRSASTALDALRA